MCSWWSDDSSLELRWRVLCHLYQMWELCCRARGKMKKTNNLKSSYFFLLEWARLLPAHIYSVPACTRHTNTTHFSLFTLGRAACKGEIVCYSLQNNTCSRAQNLDLSMGKIAFTILNSGHFKYLKNFMSWTAHGTSQPGTLKYA